MTRLLLLTVLFFWLTNQRIEAGQVVIRGNSPDFAGQTLHFRVFSNQISKNEKPFVSFKVAENGDFSCSAELDNTAYIFSHTGIFLMYLYIEPGKEYTIKLPKRVDKKPEDKLNPFFEEVKLHVLVTSVQGLHSTTLEDNKQDLNFLIRTFDDYFDPFYSKYAMKVYTKEAVTDMDTTLNRIGATFSGAAHPYFKQYYEYRMGLLKFMSTRFKSRNISDSYFLNKPVLYSNPAYMELFNEVYEKYFVFFGRTQTGKAIYDDINGSKSLSKLKITLSQNKVLDNDTLLELVILKGIHDGFYEMEFTRQAMLEILDSLVAHTHIVYHSQLGTDIRNKITRLLAGYAPPAFKLLNQDSVWVSLDRFNGSFVYLIFCTTQNYACLKEFDLLKRFQDKHPSLLEIVVVSADDHLIDIRSFAKKSQLKWTFLYYGHQPDILKDYDIRTIPTCFLIDREGKMVASPAPLPSENFDGYLFQYFRSKKIL